MLKEKPIPMIFQKQVQKYLNNTCIGYKKNNEYITLSWNQLGLKVKQLAFYFLLKGIKKNDKIAIFSNNRYEWWVSDLAIQSIGAVSVPIYVTSSKEDVLFILKHSNAKICLVENSIQVDTINIIKNDLFCLNEIIVYEKFKRKASLTFFNDVLNDNYFEFEDLFQKKLGLLKHEDLASVVYTSGTTGKPKGVMLSHANYSANVFQILKSFGNYLNSDDVFLSFLPLSHALEKTIGFYLPLCIGAKVYFAENHSTVLKNLQEVRPTLLISVPRLYEKIYAEIISKIKNVPLLKKVFFSVALIFAQKNLSYICNNISRKGLYKKIYSLFEKLLYSKIKRKLGFDRIKIAIAGGSSLSTLILKFFLGLDIRILEGYGLTESSPVTHVNRYEKIKLGSVGSPLPGTKVKLSKSGEILVKGPQIMSGYFKNIISTKKVFDSSQYLRTGDVGNIDSDNYLFITDRLKDIIVTSGGKNISPQKIENFLKQSLFIEQIAVLGDNRKYLVALIVPNFKELFLWAKKKNLIFDTISELLALKQVRLFFEKEIHDFSASLSRVEMIKNFVLLKNEWSLKSGELTSSLKIKRKVLTVKYEKEIENLYNI